MAVQFEELDEKHLKFIAAQQIFFTATAAATGRVNVSPRGMEHFRVINPKHVLYLDLTGSGNETAAHLLLIPRMTIMLCAFAGAPSIMRLYGTGSVVNKGSDEYKALVRKHFGDKEPAGARQIVQLDIECVQTSCGYAVPEFTYVGERDVLDKWAITKGEDTLAEYRRENNQFSIDGFPSGMFE